jgi:hypothetical protein
MGREDSVGEANGNNKKSFPLPRFWGVKMARSVQCSHSRPHAFQRIACKLRPCAVSAPAFVNGFSSFLRRPVAATVRPAHQNNHAIFLRPHLRVLQTAIGLVQATLSSVPLLLFRSSSQTRHKWASSHERCILPDPPRRLGDR